MLESHTRILANWTRWVPPLGLVVLVFAAFWPALSAGFVRWDDWELLVGNSIFTGGGNGLTGAKLRWMFSTTLLGHYQPLTWISYGIDQTFWGMEPLGYHLTNLVIHSANALLVYALALRLLGAGRELNGGAGKNAEEPGWMRAAAWAGAAIWAIHPLRVESVVWVTERRDVLSVLFLLLALLAYVNSVEMFGPRIRSWRLYAAAVAALVLSLLSKAWGMSFFVIALILDAWPLGRLPRGVRGWWSGATGRVLLQKAPFVVLGLLAAWRAGTAQYGAHAAKSLDEWGVQERVVQALYGLAFYAWKSVWPTDLSALYELPRVVDPFEARYLLAYATVLVGLGTCAWLWRTRPWAAAAAAMYVVSLAPVLGVFQSGEQFVADRYSYVACLGWSMAAGAGLVYAARAVARNVKTLDAARVAGVGGGLLLLLLVVMSHRQSRVWHDTETLWIHAVEREERIGPRGSLVYSYLGSELERQANESADPVARERLLEEARAVLKRAVTVNPHDGRSWFSLGNLLNKAGQIDNAEKALQRATDTLEQRYMAHVNLGNLYLYKRARPDAALSQYELAVQDVERGGRRPLSWLPYLMKGVALRQQGDREGARRAFEKALESDKEGERTAAQRELDSLGP